MCGIIFGANIQGEEKKPVKTVNDWVLRQFEDQFGRGTQGFGLVFIEKNGEYKIERACEPYKMIINLEQKKNQAPIILMHHRTPTSSQNKIQETHPILVDNGSLKYKYLGVHNGVVTNNTAMKEEHEKLGFVYTTQRKTSGGEEEFNDTECLIIELARYIENQIEELAVEKGGAFTVLQIDKETDNIKKVFYGRTSENFPLKMAKDKDEIRISSEGKGNDVAIGILYSFSINDFKIEKRKLSQKAIEETYDCYADYNCYGRHDRSNNYLGFNVRRQNGSPTDRDQMETMIEDIYEKTTEANNQVMSDMDLSAFETDLASDISDETKIMQIDAKKMSLEAATKVYNAILTCQANFMEAMIKEEKVCSMFPHVENIEKNNKDITSLASKQEQLMSEEEFINSH